MERPGKETMHKQSLRIVLYSSTAILIMALVWGIRQIPAQARLAEEAVRTSIDQELILLNGAVKVATQAMKYRMLDVLKSEGSERTSRAFQESPFQSVTLLEWDQVQWKTLWYSAKSKTDLQSTDLAQWMKDWPLNKLALDETFYAKVADIQGQAYFAIVVPVRRPNQVPMIGIGLFPANQFGLTFAADQSREIRVFDQSGMALALTHPAYLGASLKRENLVSEMLESEEAGVRREWQDGSGRPTTGVASRVPDSNLIASIEAPLRPAGSWYVQSWAYLLLCALGAAAMNWYLFSTLLKPLLAQLSRGDQVNEALRRQVQEGGEGSPKPRAVVLGPGAILPQAPLGHLDFSEPEAEPLALPPVLPGPVTLGKTVASSLRSLSPKISEYGIQVMQFGLEDIELQGDSLQLQTAIEEVLKNSIEAMQTTAERNLTISARRRDENILLTIEDSGLGIAVGDVDRVFDPFFSTKDVEGVARGLGLNVVRRVIEELGGGVRLTSRRTPEGGGTRVEMEWPVEQVERSVAAGRSLEESVLPDVELPDEFDIDKLSSELMNAPLRPSRPRSDAMIRKPKFVRTLD